MIDEVIKTNNVPIKCWTHGVLFEEEARKQLLNVANLPFVVSHLAIMPDVHAGKGCTIGTVMPTVGAIVPACVGVDLGCGMQAIKTSLVASDLPDNLRDIRMQIERDVPVGFGKWENIPCHIEQSWNGLRIDFEYICQKYPMFNKANHNVHLGTLGGGNHFIEICLDEDQCVWVMLHSGSRGIGNVIGTHFINLARNEMKRYFINLPDEDLAYLPEGSEHFSDYINAVLWAQKFAKENRKIMMNTVLKAIHNVIKKPIELLCEAIDCHHNYISIEHHFSRNMYITRKGAVRAKKDELGIIPGSMGSKSFIVKGLGNPDSFHSCSHGAGRVMSRNKAKSIVSMDDHSKDLRSIECKKDASTLDETPRAYKNIDDVMNAQSDLVEILYTLKQVLCVKG